MKRLIAPFAAIAALGVLLTACATATPYQPNVPGNSASGGYSEIRVEANRFRVTFSGNSLTSRETVESYLLYRAAELTTAQGFDWFAAADRRTERTTNYRVDADPFYSSSYYGRYGWGWRPYWSYYGGPYGWRSWDPWGYDPFWANSMDVRQINRYEATAEIVMGRGPKPAGDPSAFDAREVLTNLGPAIVRPQP
jgi:hypothetical protein